jgi:serine/threonine protein kinase/tetratricopeptide (TPR) repeat protein
MTVCPHCLEASKPGDPYGLCPACLLAGAIGTGFASTEPDSETLTVHITGSTVADSFGPYRILSVLGEGGMGTVYLAAQTEPIRRRLALKVIKLGMDTNQVLARFNHERQTLALMEHSNIARILDAGVSSNGRPFFVMDYIDGAPITSYCDSHRLTTAERLELFLPVCRAVQHAHNKGVIHRDIKPSNVLVTVEDGNPVPRVIDFGIARAMEPGYTGNTFSTQFGQMVGTPEYSSPEQVDLITGNVGAATDVYSLGALLYEMLAGAIPFDGLRLRSAGFSEMLRIMREEEPPSLAERFDALGPAGEEIAARRGTNTIALRKLLNGDLNSIVKKALEKPQHRRYASPSQLAADIELYMKGEPVLAGPPRRIRRLPKPLIGAMAGLLLLTPAAWFTKRAFDPKPQSNPHVTVVLGDVANSTGDPSFDNAFRQRIDFELRRSPDLTVIVQSRVAETLREMRKSPGALLTPEVAREICQRNSGAAVIESSLANVGSGYLVSVRARNCAAGELVGEEQSRAAGKAELLDEAGRLVASLQLKSAASLASLQRNAATLRPATTYSLEALKSFNAGLNGANVSPANGVLLLKRAIELDPEFALAYAHLGRSYADFGEQKLAAESIRRAYDLRGIVTDLENYFITYNYDREVLRNLELARQECESWSEKYPKDMLPHGFLSGFTSKGTAQYEKSIQEGQKAISLNPGFTVGYQNVAESYLFLNRPDEAKAMIELAVERKLPYKDNMAVLFLAGFLDRDRSAMDRAAAHMATASPYGTTEHLQSLVLASEGGLQRSRQASVQAVTLASQAHFAERAALFEGAAALREALFGNPVESTQHALAASQLSQGRHVDFPPAFAFAVSGDSKDALPIVKPLEQQYPEDTCVRFTYLPALRALLALDQGDPSKAVELLNVSKPYEFAQTGVSLYAYYGALYPTYVRGLTYQQLRRPREAAAEFQRMLDHPGLFLADPIGPAARLQLARALRDAGETARSKAVYQDFLTPWKDADSDIPILRRARTEYARL